MRSVPRSIWFVAITAVVLVIGAVSLAMVRVPAPALSYEKEIAVGK